MCDCQSTTGMTRREAIAGALVVGSGDRDRCAGIAGEARAAVGPAVPAVEVLPGLLIYPRDAWGADLPPVGPIEVETPQFLLVHHTASSNAYSSAAGLIQADVRLPHQRRQGLERRVLRVLHRTRRRRVGRPSRRA